MTKRADHGRLNFSPALFTYSVCALCHKAFQILAFRRRYNSLHLIQGLVLWLVLTDGMLAYMIQAEACDLLASSDLTFCIFAISKRKLPLLAATPLTGTLEWQTGSKPEPSSQRETKHRWIHSLKQGHQVKSSWDPSLFGICAAALWTWK